jgi:hypothetical protein
MKSSAVNSPRMYCGSDDPSPNMLDRGREFFKRASCRTDFHIPVAKHSSKVFIPGKTGEGLGRLWLDCFRDFDEDRCILYPVPHGCQPSRQPELQLQDNAGAPRYVPHGPRRTQGRQDDGAALMRQWPPWLREPDPPVLGRSLGQLQGCTPSHEGRQAVSERQQGPKAD